MGHITIGKRDQINFAFPDEFGQFVFGVYRNTFRIGLAGQYRFRGKNWLFARAEAGFNFLDAVDQLFNPSGRSYFPWKERTFRNCRSSAWIRN